MAANALVRTRTVSGTSTTGPHDEEMRALVHNLEDVDTESFGTLQGSLEQSGCLLQLRHTLIDNDSQKDAQDSFRRVRGFQVVLAFFDLLCNLCEKDGFEAVQGGYLAVVEQSLALLAAAMRDHPGNQKFFRTKSVGGGWAKLEYSLRRLSKLPGVDTQTSSLERFFSILFATSVADETLTNIYESAGKAMRGKQPTKSENSVAEANAVKEKLKTMEADTTEVACPDLLTILVNIWASISLPSASPALGSLAVSLPTSILEVVSRSKRNAVNAHTAGLLSAVLPLCWRGNDNYASLFQDLAILLLEAGLSNLRDAESLWLQAATSTSAASFLLRALRASRNPPSFHFDLSRQGHCSVEIATLGKSFPPLDTGGYTLIIWAKFDNFDPAAHTTLFGAFDSSQTCFVLAYLEKDSRHFILQTAIRGSKPSVRFKSTVFEQDRWYHICIVHRKPRMATSSRASLFINGEFVEQVKATYPTVPPHDKAAGVARVQAFFGTPQDLTPNTTSGHSSSQWSLASSVLFQEALSDDLISVIFHLGPRYHGNFQDCLGSFQTYQASANLNLRNENLHPGKEQQSDIILAIRQKASQLVKESSILLNVSPTAVLDSDDRNNINESQLVKSLSRHAVHNLHQYTRSGGNAIAINGAVPAINDALSQAHGLAVLMGEPTVIVPQSLDDAAWRIGGCAAVCLSIVHTARTTEDVACAVHLLIEVVGRNWRNSEVMEREHGYAILATLLKEKLGVGEHGKDTAAIPTASMSRNDLALELLTAVLEFLGYDIEHSDVSIINNPLAYRVLLVDCNLWRCSSQPVQELYFKQFLTFGRDSKHQRFNLRRYTRMRALKRLLEALKSEAISSSVMEMYTETFKALLPSAMSAEMLRSLALFITYAVHKRNVPLQSRKSVRRDARSRHSSEVTVASDDQTTSLTRFEVGVEMLRLYSDLLCTKGDDVLIKKFAKTVTNKWLLYLMSETSPEVVVLSTRILARLLVTHGEVYVKKFKDKTGGFFIMRHRLKRWWHIPAIWPPCFAILFNLDIGNLDLERSFDLFGLLDLFNSKKDLSVTYPDIFEVIMGMLQNGLRTIAHAREPANPSNLSPDSGHGFNQAQQRLSMSTMAPPDPFLTSVSASHISTFNTVVRFLADLHQRSQNYRDYAASSSYLEDLLHVLFPVVVGSDSVDASTELNARDNALTFGGDDVVVQPLSKAPPIIRTSEVETSDGAGRGKGLARGSSFVLVTSEEAPPLSSHLQSPASPLAAGSKIPQLNEGNAVIQSFLEIVISVFSDQILVRKDFPGLGLFLRTPPGFIEHQSYFESWILRNTLSQLSNTIMLDQKLLWEPKVLTNLARLFSHLGEAFFEGWFIGSADPALDLAGSILEYLQRPDIAKVKSVRLCAQAIGSIRGVVFRIVLLSLSQIHDSKSLAFLERLTYWQTVLLSSNEQKAGYLELICYLLYASLISSLEPVRLAAANLWRIILVQKPDEAAAILNHATTSEQRKLVDSFEKLVELDNESFLFWVDDHRQDLDSLFFDTLSKSWDAFVVDENKKTDENSRHRVNRRREKLKVWARDDLDREEVIRRHEVTFDHWTTNIYSSESLKHQRVVQDQQDDLLFTQAIFRRMQRDAKRDVGFMPETSKKLWRLDQTEGRNRMRLRLNEDLDNAQEENQPRKKGSEMPSLRLDTKRVQMSSAEAVGITPGGMTPTVESPRRTDSNTEAFPELEQNGELHDEIEPDESFEMIDDPNEGLDEFEDKNRKVMRSLHHGDQVKQVANISRIVGLEAVEGLLILGKDYLYLIDNFFQRADGEIVNVWQAPHEERDPYVRMISGRDDVSTRKPLIRSEEHESRSWKWSDILSVSKRRFLFRDVALEVFFGDGRSYLLTVISPQNRNDLYSLISNKAPQSAGSSPTSAEFGWRLETLKSVDEEPQTLGTRFANVFNQGPTLAATKKWQKGEMSNFHYLMLINTMAGRTYNDLTQYPVFPWIIADYTSEELDLSNPRSFRDLSKPMGCQTPSREAEFKERYKTFAEMGDHNSPPFHYGTHYSSAMIVSSYLIRLQPFVKSYLLLQGGSFDHPDRMFFSIERAWKSASRQNMTDVRELTPEFFYLPEFLVNVNDYDFGTRQNSNESIGNVELPPWAKGDPKIFISKQREALESPYVSKHLQKWIDLVFGYKQKGDAALEAVNVFHHLSYQGAKDLDNISDPVERLATIGIIHNFGQTPYQVFQRGHLAREGSRHQYKRLDTAAESLTRLPSTLLDSGERVASLSFSWKQEKLLCSGAFRLNIPPTYEKYMEWGFVDGSVRFYTADSRKQVGLFEHLHIGQLSCAVFVDSRTLITAGVDCTISIWNVAMSSRSVEIQPRATLFGHRQAVTVLALSRSFNALLSTSAGGEVFLWDLNRAEFIRKIELNTITSKDENPMSTVSVVECAQINDISGTIMICHGSSVSLFTLNADLILTQDAGDPIVSCATYEGAGTEWLERDVIFTGHKRGVVRVWTKVIRDGKFELDCIRQLNHVDQSKESGSNVDAGISCILPMPQIVYTGDEDGRVPVNLDFDARVPIPISVFPSTYRSDATSEETTVTKVEGEVNTEGRTSRVGREDTRFDREEIDIRDSRRRGREDTDVRIYEERDRRYPEVELSREKYRGPIDTQNTNLDVEIDRRGPRDSIDIEYDRRQNRDRTFETQLDVTERDYRRRTGTNFDVEYERTRPSERVEIEKEKVTFEKQPRNDMGYYDDEGQYHSFRRGVERAADRIMHPFHHHHHHDREEVVIEDEGRGPSQQADTQTETVRFVERRGGQPGNTVTIPCHFIRIGDLVILQGRPCQIIRISTSPQTGQYRYLGVDLFTRQLQEESSFMSNPQPSVYVQSMLGPVFKQYRILDITESGKVVCMTESGDVKQSLAVIDQGSLFSKISSAFSGGRGSVRALVINDGGRELIVDYKVIHGSRL